MATFGSHPSWSASARAAERPGSTTWRSSRSTRAQAPVVVTREFLTPGRINPFQYGQFIEYLCTLVPGMWAEKLYRRQL